MQRLDLIQVYFFGAVIVACMLIIVYQKRYIRWHWRAKNKAAKPRHEHLIFACSFIAIVALISLFALFV